MKRERLKFSFQGKFTFALLCSLVINVLTLSNAFAEASNDTKLLFLGNKNIAPVVYLDGTTPSGVAVDIVHALAKHIPEPIEIKAMDWSEAQALVARGEADALIQINATEERKKIYDFSDPLLESHFSIFARADKMGISGLSSLRGLRVGVESAGLPQKLLKKDPQIRLAIIANFPEGFKLLNEGSIDAVVVDYWVGSYILAENNIRNIKVTGEPIQSSYSSIAVKKGNTKLLNEINNALQIIKTDGTYQKILDNWKPKEGVFQTYEQIKERIYFVTILILIVLFLIAVIWMLTLKKELARRKTAEEKLRQQYSTLHSIINSANAPIFSVDRLYRYTSFNTGHAAVMQTLYGAQLKLGHSLIEYMTVPKDREAARRNLDRALAGEQIVEEAYSGDELRSRQYFQVSHSPIKTETGEVIGVAVLAQDLTERKQAEEETTWNLAINQALSSLYLRLVASEADIEQIADIILEKSRQLTCSAHGFVAEVDPSTGDQVAHTLTRMLPAQCQVAEELRTIRFPRRPDGLYNGLWGHALNTRESFYTNVPVEHPASVGIPEGHIVIERYLAVPVLLSGELVGQIALSNSARDYSDRDVHAIQRIAEFYALAIQQKRTEAELKRIEWMLSKQHTAQEGQGNGPDQAYGDLTALNRDGLILKSVGGEVLRSIAADYLDLLGTSSAIYEVNGDYAFGIFSSNWCRMMDLASRKRCDTDDNTAALSSGQWLCHESCWTCCSKESIATRAPVDIACSGGIRLYGVPIIAHQTVIGSINFGYGDVPKDPVKLRALASAYHLDYEDLLAAADTYDSRPPYIVEMAKSRLRASAKLIGIMVERKQAEEEVRKLNTELDRRVLERTAELETANKELDAFAYAVSHDLRSPLRHIDGFVELLQKKAGTTIDEQGRHYMDAISDTANKMGLLIDDLLSFSRMGRHAMSFQQVGLGPLVREVIRELEPDTIGRTIEWRIADLPAVSCDVSMLRLVLGNLISNALKFTRPRQQAQIEIGSMPGQASEAVIFVRDNGVGFDMTYVDKLFGVFQRLHRTEEFEGTGIGLANVRRIIARHGGRTWAEGRPDQGATFYFALPQA